MKNERKLDNTGITGNLANILPKKTETSKKRSLETLLPQMRSDVTPISIYTTSIGVYKENKVDDLKLLVGEGIFSYLQAL